MKGFQVEQVRPTPGGGGAQCGVAGQEFCTRVCPSSICSEDLRGKSNRGRPRAFSLSLQVCSSSSYSCTLNTQQWLTVASIWTVTWTHEIFSVNWPYSLESSHTPRHRWRLVSTPIFPTSSKKHSDICSWSSRTNNAPCWLHCSLHLMLQTLKTTYRWFNCSYGE